MGDIGVESALFFFSCLRPCSCFTGYFFTRRPKFWALDTYDMSFSAFRLLSGFLSTIFVLTQAGIFFTRLNQNQNQEFS